MNFCRRVVCTCYSVSIERCEISIKLRLKGSIFASFVLIIYDLAVSIEIDTKSIVQLVGFSQSTKYVHERSNDKVEKQFDF